MPQWQKIEVPRGSYVGWGNKRGQHVTGTVTDYDVTGGSDFNGNACPQLDVELTERAASFDKEGNRTNFEVGELVSVTCGLTVLKKMVKSAEPKKVTSSRSRWTARRNHLTARSSCLTSRSRVA